MESLGCGLFKNIKSSDRCFIESVSVGRYLIHLLVLLSEAHIEKLDCNDFPLATEKMGKNPIDLH